MPASEVKEQSDARRAPRMERRRGLSSGAGFLLAAILVAGATAFVFGRSVAFDFIGLDDPDNILANPNLNPPSWSHLARIWRKPYLSLYVPLTYSWWSAEAVLAWPAGHEPTPGVRVPFNPHVFHAGSVLLHALCGVTVLAILRRLTGKIGPACAGALFFALHPVQAESVGWITENKGLLSALFSLVALWQYARFAQLHVSPKRRSGRALEPQRRWHFLLATLAFALALLAKPSAAALPLVAAAIDWLILDRPWRHVARGLALWVAMAGTILLLTSAEQSGSTILFDSPLWARPLIAGDALAFYIVKLVAPFGLGPDYGRSVPVVLDRGVLWYSWLLPAAIGCVVWVLPGRRVGIAAAAVFVVALLPVLGLVPFVYQSISTVADRYEYLAMLGPAIGLAWCLSARWTPLTIAAAAGVLVLLALAGFWQIGTWRNDETWMARALVVNPASIYGHEVRAQTLIRQGKGAAALAERRLSVDRNPRSLEALFNVGKSLLAQGRVEDAAECYESAIQIYPGARIAYAFLAECLVRQGRFSEGLAAFQQAAHGASRDRNLSAQCTRIGTDLMNRNRYVEAHEVLSVAVRLDADSIEALNDLAVLLARQGDKQGAFANINKALAIDPRHVETLVNRGSLLAMFGELAAGIASYQQALAYQPGNFNGESNLALGLLKAGRIADALAAYRRALAANPNWLHGKLQLAWLLATCDDPAQRNAAEATQLAEELCDATKYKNPGALDALAAARAEAGLYQAAVQTAERALTFATDQNNSKQAEAIKLRLKEYRAGRPYHEPAGASL